MGMFQKFSALLRGEEKEARPPRGMWRSAVSRPETAKVPVHVPTPEPEPAGPVVTTEPQGDVEPKTAGVKRVVLDEAGLSILDLRGLPSSRLRIVGSGFWVTDSGRYKHGGSEYLLVREPKNKWDANAVAVYGKGRKVGHLSEAKAAALAPILDQLSFDAYRVTGAAPANNSIRMWIDVPAVPKLRAFAKNLA